MKSILVIGLGRFGRHLCQKFMSLHNEVMIVDRDEAAVTAALESGKLAYYCADVVSKEPIDPGNPLLTAPNCILTPHIAWAPKETRVRLHAAAVENLRAFLAGAPQNVVNP